MRKNWTYKTFGEVGSFLRGKSIQKADFVEKGMPCIHYGQIHTKFGISVEKHLSEIPQEVYNKSIIASPGDVIIAITSEDLEGSCKSTAWLGNYDVAVSAHAAVFKHNLNPKFIAYYLRSNSFYTEKEKYARGFKVMEIKPTDIARIPIPVPSQEIQQSVVDELDKTNELIALKRSELTDLDILGQSIFYEMFGDPIENEKEWKQKRIGDVCVEKKDIKRASKYFKDSDDIKYIDISSIDNTSNCIIGTTSFSFDNAPSRAQQKVEKGDILVSLVRPNLKNIAIVNLEGNNLVASSGFCVLRAKEISNLFIKSLVLTPHFTEYLVKRVAGANYPAVREDDIKDCLIGVPPLTLQQSFTQRIEAIEKQKEQISSSINDLETLLASRMQYWFD
jgi:type I restriction enzyme S subunit